MTRSGCYDGAMSDYLVPTKITQYEQLIKKSRFIAFAAPVQNSASAHAFISSIRQQYPDAGHVCYAFVAGEPNNTPHVGFSDDGEPNGTAGKPMLNVLQHGDVGDIVIAVVRYFGGVKLGTGGLARAYSSSVTEVLKIMPTQKRIATIHLKFTAEFALEDPIRRALQSANAREVEVGYSNQLSIRCTLPEVKLAELKIALNDLSRGQISLKVNAV